MTRYIYIFSSGHSGSTLLDLLIGNLPDVFSLGEVRHLSDYIESNESCSCGRPVRTCGVWEGVRDVLAANGGPDIFSDPRGFRITLEPRTRGLGQKMGLAARLLLGLAASRRLAAMVIRCGRGAGSIRRILQNRFDFYDAVRKSTGAEVVVDSSKSLVTMIWLWLMRSEDVRVIYLVRDGRGVMASNIRKGKDPARAARSWARTNRLARMLLKRLPDTARFFLRYEDLCEDPEAVMRRVSDFLGFTYEPSVLKFSGRKIHSIGGNRMRFNKDSRIENRETWREKLSREQLDLFARVAGKVNRSFGYSND